MSNQKPGLLTRLIQWIIAFFTGKLNDKKKRTNDDTLPPGGPKATSVTVRKPSTLPDPKDVVILVNFDLMVSGYVNGSIQLIKNGSILCTLNNLSIGSSNTILLEDPAPDITSQISNNTVEVKLFDVKGNVVSDQQNVGVTVSQDSPIPDVPLGGPKATSATVRKESPEKFLITSIKAGFDNPVNGASYTASGSTISVTYSSNTATFSNLSLDANDSTNKTLLSSTVSGTLGGVEAGTYTMTVALNTADGKGNSTNDISVTVE